MSSFNHVGFCIGLTFLFHVVSFLLMYLIRSAGWFVTTTTGLFTSCMCTTSERCWIVYSCATVTRLHVYATQINPICGPSGAFSGGWSDNPRSDSSCHPQAVWKITQTQKCLHLWTTGIVDIDLLSSVSFSVFRFLLLISVWRHHMYVEGDRVPACLEVH